MLKNIIKFKLFTLVTLLFLVHNISAQHRGDSFGFQGLTNFGDNWAKASAMGGAVTALSGDVSMMFYNPAGISNLNGIQVTTSANLSNFSWRENQNFRPNRYFLTLPFYLEGLYVPDPAEDGMYDYERLWENNLIDSSYVVNPPKLGMDPFSEEAADWKESANNFVFNNIAIGIPFSFAGEEFTASIGYNRTVTIEDFDRDATYLDPHPGSDAYGEIGRVNGNDTLIMNWSDFYRKSSGKIDNIAFAFAYSVSEQLNLGIGLNYSTGSSKDLMYLNRIGTFHLINQQRFRYWYTDVYDETAGESKYSAYKFNMGFQLDLDQFKLGVKVDLPYTLTKDWDYTFTYRDSTSSSTVKSQGTDKLKIPAVFNFGVSYAPVDNFMFSIDYEYAPYNKITAEYEIPNPTFFEQPDRHTIRFGAMYKPIDLITVMAGYRDIPADFVPDGAAVRNSGPKAKSYNAGISLNTNYGVLDFAYEYRVLRYYDSYYSNTNYNTNIFSNILFGYTIKF